MNGNSKKMKVAFVVGEFPSVSETFIINQVADLLDRGIDVEIFSFRKGGEKNISEKFSLYDMGRRVHYCDMPKNLALRCARALPKMLYLLKYNRRALFCALNVARYGRNALSLKLLYWVEPFARMKSVDLIHCHFGTIASKFLIIKDILELPQRMITSFYGYDVSHIFQQKGPHVYDRLKQESSLFFVMSENMKERVVAYGFDEGKVEVLPVSIDVDAYPFHERTVGENERVRIASVGRFVEKKGFDDLLRALAIVKERTKKQFKCFIVGGGPLEKTLHELTQSLGIEDIVEYKGYMKIEGIIDFFKDIHFFVQPSKTAINGDME